MNNSVHSSSQSGLMLNNRPRKVLKASFGLGGTAGKNLDLVAGGIRRAPPPVNARSRDTTYNKNARKTATNPDCNKKVSRMSYYPLASSPMLEDYDKGTRLVPTE